MSRFLERHRNELERYARFSRGEFSLDDACSEACIAWLELARSPDACLFNAAFDDAVLRRTRRQLDRMADRKLRDADGYDDAVGAGDSTRPLRETIAGDDGDHPLSLLIAAENALTPEARETEARLDRIERPDDSPAGAWALLMRRFDNSTRAVAFFLRVSISHAHQCRTKVIGMAERQGAIVFSQLGADAKLGPWRRRHYERTQVQLKLDFGESLL